MFVLYWLGGLIFGIVSGYFWCVCVCVCFIYRCVCFGVCCLMCVNIVVIFGLFVGVGGLFEFEL